MNLNTGWTELNAGMKTLRLCWEETHPQWTDAVRQDFEENHWDPLNVQVVATLRAIEGLSQSLIRAQHDCD